MIRKIILFFFLSFILTTLTSIGDTYAQQIIEIKETKESTLSSTNSQVIFEQNLGQLDTDAKYYTRGNKYSVYLYNDSVVFVPNINDNNNKNSYFKFNLINTEENVELVGVNQLKSISNYIYGDDSDNYKDIPNYSKVMYKNIYKDIDLIFYEINGDIKYDFIVKPGADPNDINIKVEEADEIIVDKEGNLVIHLDNEEFISEKPYIFQKDKEITKEITGG